jgi:predicted nucleic acid-binding protein
MIVDASVWISAMLPGDVHHETSSKWIDKVNASGWVLIVPAHYPAEVCGAISRLQPPGVSLTQMTEFLFDPEFFDIHQITSELSRLSADVAGTSALRGSDAVYVALASQLDLPLVTWDKQQRERGAVFCRTMTPVEAMEMAE